MESIARRCRRCLLPENVPGLTLDESDLCDICQVTPPVSELIVIREQVRADLESTLETYLDVEPYACVVAYSGGKDSSFALKLLVEHYRLRCIAVTIDNGFLSRSVARNCRAICGSLGVDHMLFTPNQKFVRGMYRASAVNEGMHAPAAMQRASSICNSCITLVNTYVLQKALELGAPLVAGGYIGGQLPRDAATMTIRPGQQARIRTALVKRFVHSFGSDARTYFELGRTPDDALREITVINPMLGYALTDDEIINQIEELGWKRPQDTGMTSTNCRLNDLGVYIHERRHGFHPYAFEIADQLRHGLLSREAASKKLESLPELSDIAWLAEQIGVATDAI